MLLRVAVHGPLYIPLEIHEGKRTGILLRLVSGFNLHHHTGIGPFGIAGCVGHAVEHHRLRLGGRRNQNAARAHAEGEHAAAVYLLHKGIFCRWHKRLILTVIPNLVQKPLRVLHPHAQGKALGLQRPAFSLEKFIDIPCRMARCQNHLGSRINACATVYIKAAIGPADNIRHPRVKMVFPAMRLDALANVFHHFRQFVRADMRMRVNQNVRVRAEGHQLMQHLPDIAPLGRARVQLSIAESTSTAFPVTIIGIRVQHAFRRKPSHVHLASLHIFSPFQDDGLQAQLEQLQSGKHACRAGAHHNHGTGLVHSQVRRHTIRLIRLIIPVGLYPIPVQDVLPGVNAPAGYFHMPHFLRLYAQGLGRGLTKLCVRERLTNLLCYLEFFHNQSFITARPSRPSTQTVRGASRRTCRSQGVSYTAGRASRAERSMASPRREYGSTFT